MTVNCFTASRSFFKAKKGDGVDSDDVVGDGDDGYGNLAKMM